MNNKYTRLLERLTPSQKRAVMFPKNVLLQAVAGSGKTTVLVARFIESFKAALEREPGKSLPESLSSIVAITFTEKAAAEMKARIHSLLIDGLKTGPTRGHLAGAWRQARDAMRQSNIGTIHSFCASILQRFPLEAGIDPEFGIIDATQSYLWQRDAVEAVSREAGQSGALGADSSLFTVYPHKKVVKWLMSIIQRIEPLRPCLELYANMPEPRLAERIQEVVDGSELASADKRSKDDVYDPLVEANRLKLLTKAALRAHSVYRSRKRALSILDFEDLQRLLLKLLSDPHGGILNRLRAEFSTLMIDEVQDTNNTQYELARLLASTHDGTIREGRLFAVGDPRQSIYAFRGADPGIFHKWVKLVIGHGGEEVQMRENFRSLPDVIGFINRVFAEGNTGQKENSPSMRPARSVPCVGHTGTIELLFPASECPRRDKVGAEAEMLARRIASMVAAGSSYGKLVFDEARQESRPCRYDDIALLIHRRTFLPAYEDALRRAGVPFCISSGIGFYERQEVKDISCFLKFLNNTADDVAVAGLLRSPFFAVSDDALLWLSSRPARSEWDRTLWGKLRSLDKKGPDGATASTAPAMDPLDYDGLMLARQLLDEAIRRCHANGPGWAIRFLLRRTGALAAYSAQPDGGQCLANIEKIEDLLAHWATLGYRSIGAAVRMLDRLTAEGVREGQAQAYSDVGEGVNIMTIHAAKGLEFPVVIVADVFAKPYWGASDGVYVDAQLGLGIMAPSATTGRKQVSTRLRKAIGERLKQAAAEEQARLWYVACTRARDHLLLSGAVEGKSSSDTFGWRIIDRLGVDLAATGDTATEIEVPGLGSPITLFTDKAQLPGEPALKHDPHGFIAEAETAASEIEGGDSRASDSPLSLVRYVHPLGPLEFEPEVSPTDLNTYGACPRRYLLEHLLGSGLLEVSDAQTANQESGPAHGREFGTAVHKVFELMDAECDREDAALAKSVANAVECQSLRGALQDALTTLRNSALGEAMRRARRLRREVPFVLRIAGARFRGKIDLLYQDHTGRTFIVDYKTDMDPSGIEARYRAQMMAYVLAASRPHGLSVADISINMYLARTGDLVPIPVSEDALVWVSGLAEKLCAALRCARTRPYLNCFEERREACNNCGLSTKLACLRLRGAAESE